MRFYERKRRQPPAVIIVPLIDILLVLLVFMMATSTFKTQPTIKLTLPESRQGRAGAAAEETVVITVAPTEPHFFYQDAAVTLEELGNRLQALAGSRPEADISL
ncbi:MAG: biopolymer transporter ExbD, partial [Verrucomicrobiae bacterium]|nr:biopolymer transporter ExbD [Verrucomicrobiae bacterium]